MPEPARVPTASDAGAPGPALLAAKARRPNRPSPAAHAAAAPMVRLAPVPSTPLSAGLPAAATSVLRGRGGGDALLPAVHDQIKATLNVDASVVRVHTDPAARQAAQSLGARAFAFGTDVYLGPGEHPGDLTLLAHEVAHVVQQQGAPSIARFGGGGGTGAALEREANQAGAAVAAGQQVTIHERTAPGQVQRKGVGAAIWGAVSDTAGAVAGAAGSLVNAAGEFVESAAWSMLERIAPELVPIIRGGILPWLQENIVGAVDRYVDGLLAPVRSVTEFIDKLISTFGELSSWSKDALAKIAKGDCSSIAEAADKIQKVFEGLASPIVDKVKAMADKVGGFLSGLWTKFGAPIWDFLKQVGGAMWDKLQRFGSWVWGLTKPMRDAYGAAWEWFKKQLGVGSGPDGEDGLLQWVQGKAKQAWDKVSAVLAPYKTQLMAVGAVLVMLSPAGPLIALGAGVVGLIKGARWLAANMNKPGGAMIEGRTEFERTIIPGINNAVAAVTAGIQKASAYITQKITSVVSTFSGAVGAVAGSVLRFAVSFAEWALEKFRRLAVWATEHLARIGEWVAAGLVKLKAFLEPVLAVLRRIGNAMANILDVVALVAEKAWNFIKPCLRDPVVKFLTERILKKVPFFAAILEVPDVWARIQNVAKRVVAGVFRGGSLLDAVTAVFTFLLDVLKVPIALVKAIWAKAGATLDLIMANPGGFLKNVLGAMKLGLGNFFKNILTHLANGVASWLFGQLGEAGIKMPKDFSVGSIFGLVLDVLGITLDHVLDLLAKKIGKPAVEKIRKSLKFLSGVWNFVKIAIEKGVAGLWDELKSSLSKMWDTVLDGVIGYLTDVVIKRASAELLKLFDPTGIMAVITAIQAVWNTIQTALEYINQILAIIDNFLDMLGQIATGVIAGAASKLEGLLGKALPVAIGWLANYLGLGKLGKQIKAEVEKVRKKVDDAILGLIQKALDAGKALLAALGIGTGPGAEPKAEEADTPPEQEFDVDDEDHEHHKIWWKEEGGQRTLVMSSPVTVKVGNLLTKAKDAVKKLKGARKTRKENAITDAEKILQSVESLEKKLKSAKGDALVQVKADLLTSEGQLTQKLKLIIRGTKLATARARYKVEGRVATYSQANSIAGTGDGFEADHQPAASFLETAAETKIPGTKRLLFKAGSGLRQRYLTGSHASGGLTIVLGELRHAEGRTYGSKATALLGDLRTKIDDKVEKKSDEEDQIVAVAGVLRKEAAADVAAILEVVDNKHTDEKYWGDLHEKDIKPEGSETPDEAMKTLAAEIRASVKEGTARIKLQTFSDIG